MKARDMYIAVMSFVIGSGITSAVITYVNHPRLAEYNRTIDFLEKKVEVLERATSQPSKLEQ